MSRRSKSRPPMIPRAKTPTAQLEQVSMPHRLLLDGETLHRRGDIPHALHLYRKALELSVPKSRVCYRAMFMVGLCAYQLRIYDEAALLLDEVAKDPQEWQNPDLHYNRGMIAASQGYHDEAMQHYRTCLALKPGYGPAEMHLGNLLRETGDLETAELCYQRVLERNDADPHAQYNLAFVLLQRGDLARGFKLYDARWQCDGHLAEYGRRDITSTRWTAAQPVTRRVLVYCDQGLGDTLQFVRYLPWLMDRCAEVIFEAPRALLRFFAPLANDPRIRLIGRGDPIPEHDCSISVMSLSAERETTLESIPAPVVPAIPSGPPMLSPDLPGLRIGLVWGGNRAHHNDWRRSASVEALLTELAHVPGVTWVSLQMEDRGPELVHALPAVLPTLHANGSHVVDATGHLRDFADTARLMRDELDAVITVDTSVAHLAGTIGVPTWLMIPYHGEWRWLEGRADTPWYPSMRIVRQSTDGDWSDVAAQLRTTLTELLHR